MVPLFSFRKLTNMNKIIFPVLALIFLANATPAMASARVAGSSAEFKYSARVTANDPRVATLEKYLAKHNSPLADHAAEFVTAADAYQLDWRFVPAIAGVESTFGKRIPGGSFNAYGWANGKYKFTSWDHSINVVSQALREKYLDRGAPNINAIARRYAPPSKTWAGNVRFFMKKIEPFPVYFDLEG